MPFSSTSGLRCRLGFVRFSGVSAFGATDSGCSAAGAGGGATTGSGAGGLGGDGATTTAAGWVAAARADG
jgi:hypothetical protein